MLFILGITPSLLAEEVLNDQGCQAAAVSGPFYAGELLQAVMPLLRANHTGPAVICAQRSRRRRYVELLMNGDQRTMEPLRTRIAYI